MNLLNLTFTKPIWKLVRTITGYLQQMRTLFDIGLTLTACSTSRGRLKCFLMCQSGRLQRGIGPLVKRRSNASTTYVMARLLFQRLCAQCIRQIGDRADGRFCSLVHRRVQFIPGTFASVSSQEHYNKVPRAKGLQLMNDTSTFGAFSYSFLMAFYDELSRAPCLSFPLMGDAVPRNTNLENV